MWNATPLLPKIEVELFGDEDPIILPNYLRDAYDAATEFCRLLRKRTKAAGFLETMLLRRLGSSIIAGKNTANKILSRQLNETDEDDLEVEDGSQQTAIFREMTPDEISALNRFIATLDANSAEDPKAEVAIRCLTTGVNGTEPWLELGCIIFSQYYDTIRWLAEKITREFPSEIIGIYAGGGGALWRAEEW